VLLCCAHMTLYGIVAVQIVAECVGHAAELVAGRAKVSPGRGWPGVQSNFPCTTAVQISAIEAQQQLAG
jgi:hypothetical protein